MICERRNARRTCLFACEADSLFCFVDSELNGLSGRNCPSPVTSSGESGEQQRGILHQRCLRSISVDVFASASHASAAAVAAYSRVRITAGGVNARNASPTGETFCVSSFKGYGNPGPQMFSMHS